MIYESKLFKVYFSINVYLRYIGGMVILETVYIIRKKGSEDQDLSPFSI